MRKSIAIIITSILVLSGCNKQQSVSDRLLNEVEKAIAINPDSASNLLKSISSPEKLDDKAFALARQGYHVRNTSHKLFLIGKLVGCY